MIWQCCSVHFLVQAFEITLFVPDVKQIIQSVKGAIDTCLQNRKGSGLTPSCWQMFDDVCIIYLNSNLSSI